jgi:superoxide dismutase, Cu-Zn family
MEDRMRALLWLIPLSLAAACTVGAEAKPKTAAAVLESRSDSTVTGNALFAYSDHAVLMTLTVEGASPGSHGVHLHAVGDCSDPAAMSAMGHWNPTMAMHGHPTAAGAHHMGDCGNTEVGADGTGILEFTAEWTIGTNIENDLVGKAIIFHAATDDGMTQMPPGNAGARQACGVIELVQ